MRHWKTTFKKLHHPFPTFFILLFHFFIIIYVIQGSLFHRSGHVALFFSILSFNLYLFLLFIRKARSWRQTSLFTTTVIFTRKYIQFHMPFALFSIAWLLIHSYGMMYTPPSLTKWTGMTSVFIIVFVLVTGWLRKRKASGKRRRSHRYMGCLFFILVGLHLFSVYCL